VWWAGLGEEGGDVLACDGFLGRGYRVFEIVGYGIYGEGAGLFEEFGGGRGDWERLVGRCEGRLEGSIQTIEERSSENGR